MEARVDSFSFFLLLFFFTDPPSTLVPLFSRPHRTSLRPEQWSKCCCCVQPSRFSNNLSWNERVGMCSPRIFFPFLFLNHLWLRLSNFSRVLMDCVYMDFSRPGSDPSLGFNRIWGMVFRETWILMSRFRISASYLCRRLRRWLFIAQCLNLRKMWPLWLIVG